MKEKPYSILLIEDSGSDAFTVQRVLKRCLGPACQIKHAENMEQARAALTDHQDIELVLVDLHLPDTNGENDTLVQLDLIRGKIPIVILTAMKDYALAVKTVQDGATEFVDKSLVGSRPEILCDIVNYTVTRFRDAAAKDGLAEQIG